MDKYRVHRVFRVFASSCTNCPLGTDSRTNVCIFQQWENMKRKTQNVFVKAFTCTLSLILSQASEPIERKQFEI